MPENEDNTAQKTSKYANFSGPYSVKIQENTDQNNSIFGNFLRSVKNLIFLTL